MFCQAPRRFAEKADDFFFDKITIDQSRTAEKKNGVFLILKSSGDEFQNHEPLGCEDRNVLNLDGFLQGLLEQLLKFVFADYPINRDVFLARFDEIAFVALNQTSNAFKRKFFRSNKRSIPS